MVHLDVYKRQGLGVVKISVNGKYVSVIAFLGNHLALLHFADPFVWIEYDLSLIHI